MAKTFEHSHKLVRVFKKILPSPFTIAILLTLLTLILAQFLTKPEALSHGTYFLKLLGSWQNGLWDSSGGGLYFAFQMMLILVLGHILALTPAVDHLIQKLLQFCTNSVNSVVIVALGSIALGLVNWGLGLIFGSIIARKVGEKFSREKRPLNYGLVGAAGYATMMIWHSGLSGSATTKAMEKDAITGIVQNSGINGDFPESIPFEATIGSTMNLSLIALSLILVPLTLYVMAKKTKNLNVPEFGDKHRSFEDKSKNNIAGAERLDHHHALGIALGLGILAFGIYQAVKYEGRSTFGFIQLNFINFMFLGLSLALHKSIHNFSKALQIAIGDISGILIQFPFYFGILAIMNSSGLIALLSNSMTSIASAYTLPLMTFFSAGVVNFFVPSGGGQWAIQAPIILESVQKLGADLPKTVMGMAYGDQLTNMLQPFWALPLLGITKLKPQQLLPYTFVLFLIGGLIFGLGLLVF